MDPRKDKGNTNKEMDNFIYNTQAFSVTWLLPKIYQNFHFGNCRVT